MAFQYTIAVSSIFLFTGENTFLIRQERYRWKQEFSKKHGEENCAVIDGQKLTIRTLLDDVAVLPFLAEKRLVIVDTVPKATKEEMETLFASIHPQVVLLFCDPKPDKRTAGTKYLLANAEVKEFKPVAGAELAKWIDASATQSGATFDVSAKQTLLEFIGTDMNALSMEIEKLALSSNGKTITRDDIEALSIPTDEGIVWRMTDLLCEGKQLDALKYTKRMLDRGGDAYGLWAILLSMLKNLTLVRAAVDSGLTSSQSIAEKTSVHVFALRSLLPYAKRVHTPKLASFVSWAANADKDLKTGAIRSTDEAPQELHALIDQFILHAP